MGEVPVYSFTAFSGTGKTTFLEKLIPELKRRGLRVGVLKHDAHDFDIDHEGKDTYRMTRAGADITAISSGTKAAVMINHPVDHGAMLEMMSGADIILTEGYSDIATKRILVHREASGNPLRIQPDECFAVVSDSPVDTETPVFSLEEPSALADFIISDMKNYN